jgi:hypothetical protein
MLARQSGAHLLCVHHAGKTDKANPVDAALGSIGFSGGVDTIIVYKRTERYRTFETTQRYGEDIPETVIEWDPERKAISLGAEKSKAEAIRVGAEMLDYLRTAGVPKTEPEIDDPIEARAGVKRMALRELVKEGKVVRSGTGKKGDPYLYTLPPKEAEEEL